MPSGGFAHPERWLRSPRAVASLTPSGGFAGDRVVVARLCINSANRTG